MRYAKWFVVGFLTLTILAPDVQAQRRSRRNQRNTIAAAVALGVIGAVVANRSNRGYYRDRGYGSAYGNAYGNAYGSSYGYSPYRASSPYGYASGDPYGYRVVPTVNPYQSGPVSYVDEGAYRNYRDAAGNFVGRVPLASLAGERW